MASQPSAGLTGAPAGPAEIRVGCASWLDTSLIQCGRFYPRRTMTSEARLRWYARFFDTVEVNATYYALPSPRNAELWVARTPASFRFHVKAYSLMTGHHPRLETLPADLRVLLPEAVTTTRRGEVHAHRFPPEALDRCFGLFRDGLAPLANAGKLGYVLFQLAPWVRHGAAQQKYLASLAGRLPGWPIAVEFRNETWVPQRTAEMVRFLGEHGLSFVCVDAPWQPWVAAATAEWAVVRLHGQNRQGWLDQLAGREPTVAEKYDYLYRDDELHRLAEEVRGLSRHARRVAVTFNNNSQDYPVQNALALKELLGLSDPFGPEGPTDPPPSDSARRAKRL